MASADHGVMGNVLRFEWPSALWLLVAGLPFLAWSTRRTLTNFPRPQRRLQTVLRCLVVSLVVFAIARPVWQRMLQRESVVYLVDLSASVSPAALGRAADWIETHHRTRRPNHWRILGFADGLVSIASVEALRETAQRAPEGLRVSATNLARALSDSRAAFALHHARRVVLFSDGRSTTGNVEHAVARLQHEGIRVDAVPLNARSLGDVWIDSLETSGRPTSGGTFTVTSMVFAQVPAGVEVSARHRGRTLASRRVALEIGPNVVPLDVVVAEPGPAVLEVVLDRAGDPVPQNNLLATGIDVRPRPRVLYVEGRPQSARYLQHALDEGGFEVVVAEPATTPDLPGGFDAYDAVILSDVEGRALSASTMRAVDDYVRERGGGLVLAGGAAVYGEEGYSATPIERVLPVTFDVKEPPDEVAVVIVMDRSWSMNGPFIELAREACKAAVDVLADHHYVGVIAFNDGYHWPVRLQRAINRSQIRTLISGIQPSGHTVMYAPLEDAYHALREIQATTKHVILLSDGRTYLDPFETLVTQMARERITVSTVAIGSGADRSLLASIARWGNGRAYAFEDAREVPQIFVKEAERVARRSIEEDRVAASVRQPSTLFDQIDMPSAPPLRGYTRVRSKEPAEVLLTTPSGDPLLARWQVGLGRSAMFASDVKDRWASAWLRWAGYGAFWTRVIRDVMRRPDDAGRLTLERDARTDDDVEVRMSFDAVEHTGRFVNLARLEVELSDGAQTSVVPLTQTAPGHYQGTTPIASDRSYLARVRTNDVAALARGTSLQALLPAAPADEYRFRPPDADLLQAISRDTGGIYESDAQAVRPVPSVRAPVALWAWLLLGALVLYPVDLLLRRVRVQQQEPRRSGEADRRQGGQESS